MFSGFGRRCLSVNEYEQKQKRKAIYIPLCCQGKITNLEAATQIGIAIQNVLKLKKRYREKGKAAFIRANKGHPPYHKKYSSLFKKESSYDLNGYNQYLCCIHWPQS